MLRRRLPEGSRESSLWDGWLESLIILQGFPCTPPGVDVLEGGKLTSNNVAGSSHDPLQSPAVASSAVSKPGGDAAGQDALHSAGVEGSEDSGARSKLPQPSQEEEALMCLLQHCICVSRPCEILGDVNAEELKAVYPLHRCLVDSDGCVFSTLSPVIHHQLLGLVDVEWEVVLLTPFSQGTHLLSVGHLIVVGDQAYHRCKFDDDIGAVCSCTVMCVQGVQEWAENAALRCTSVEGQGRWGVVAHSDHLTSACQEVQDPAAQRSVQSQSLELRNQCGRHYGVKCRTIIHEQHPHIGVLIFQVGESSVQGEGNSIVCGTVTAVCKL